MSKQELLQKAQEFTKLYVSDPARCCVCNTDLSVQGHHVYPRHLNGPQDGPLVPLCSTHHLQIHYLSGNSKDYRYPTDLTKLGLFKMKALVTFIVRAKLCMEDEDPTLVPRKVIVSIPHGLLQRCHKRKQDLGYSSLGDYLTHLMLNDTMSL